LSVPGAHAAVNHSIRAYISLSGREICITYKDHNDNNIPVDLANFTAFDNYAINAPELGGVLRGLMLAPLNRQGGGGPYWPLNYNVPPALTCNGDGPQNGNGDAEDQIPEQHRGMNRPEGASAAEEYTRRIVEESRGRDGLGRIVDWREFDGSDAPGTITSRGGLTPGGNAINAFPGVPGTGFHPVFHVTLPIDPSPGSRPLEALTRRSAYYMDAAEAIEEWVDHHRHNATPGPLELHVLSEAWPLLAVGTGDDPRFVHRYRHWHFRHGDIHAQLRMAGCRLPRLSIFAKLLIEPGRAIQIYAGTAVDWPAGW
jgi:hypothetical protein